MEFAENCEANAENAEKYVKYIGICKAETDNYLRKKTLYLNNYLGYIKEKNKFTIDLRKVKYLRLKRFDEMQILYNELIIYGRMKQKVEYIESALLMTLINFMGFSA
jgi:hypothetical protein